MDKNQPVKKELVEAWNRLMDNTYTIEDLTLLLDSVKGDEHLQELYEVLDRLWNEALANTPTLTKEQEAMYRKEAAQLLNEYENKKEKRTEQLPSQTNVRFRKIWYAVAAVFLLGLLLPTTYLFFKQNTAQTAVQYIEESTLCGEIKTIYLDDQTKVTLNADSKLTYPASFAKGRTVELIGEAIFEVTSDPNRPFTVTTTEMKVSVLGTVFDVKAYPDDELAMVSVASGIVEVDLPGGKALLEQNFQVKMNKTTGSFEKTTVDAEKYLSWPDGVLFFLQTPMKEAVNMLNRAYPQIVFELAEGDYPDLISGKLETKNLDSMLNLYIKSIGLSYHKTGNKIILYQETNH